MGLPVNLIHRYLRPRNCVDLASHFMALILGLGPLSAILTAGETIRFANGD
jgi:hypothetical protein